MSSSSLGVADPGLVALVDALRDVRGLRADGDLHAAGAAVEALVGVVVADLEDLLADQLRDRRVGVSVRDLTGDDDEAGGEQRLDGDPAVRRVRSCAIRESRTVSLIASAILSG